MRRLLALALVGTALTAGCSSSKDSPQSDSSVGLGMVPASATTVTITDWAGWKKRLDAADVTSASSDDERTEFLRKTNDPNAAFLGGNLANFARLMAATAQWSMLDVDRELTYATSGPSVTILAIRSGLSMDIVTSSLTKAGYTTASGPHGAQLLTRSSLPSSQDDSWQVPLGAVAVLADKHLVLYAFSAEPLTAAVNAVFGEGQTLRSDDRLGGLAAKVDDSLSAVVNLGDDACLTPEALIGPGRPSSSAVEAIRAQVAAAGTVTKFDALGVLVSSKGMVGVDLVFADAGDAQSNLDARRALANGESIRTRQPYSELFTVTSADTDGRTLRLALDFRGESRRLAAMVSSRDLLFAACP